jgi:hypothetical protein
LPTEPSRQSGTQTPAPGATRETGEWQGTRFRTS